MIDVERLRGGDRRVLARAITLVESGRPGDRQAASALLEQVLPYSGGAIRIGLTGAPGVGKSTLIEALGGLLIGQGHRPAVLAVDPSSSLSGGSILGDKTRMPELSADPAAFIRPTPAGGSPGGVARRTRESIILCEAAGFDVVIVETVGVGQSETRVSEMTDLFLLMLLPGGGDELQGVKRGIMELADMVVINKADDEMQARATRSASEIEQALRLIRPRHAGWRTPVLTASARDNVNVDGIWQRVREFHAMMRESGELEAHRNRQARHGFWNECREILVEELRADPRLRATLAETEARVRDGGMPPSVAARELVAEFLGRPGSGLKRKAGAAG